MQQNIIINNYKYIYNESYHIKNMIYNKCQISDIIYMIEKYINIINSDIQGFIFDSIINNNIELLRILVEKYKINVNIKTDLDSTPLMFAGYLGNLEIVKYLCNNGAKTSYKNKYNNDIYFYSNKEIIDYLYSRKKIYIIIYVEGSNIESYSIIETNKDNLGIYIKNNIKNLLKFFIKLIDCDIITSKFMKYIDKFIFLTYDNESKIKHINYIFHHFTNKEIVNEFIGYNLYPHKLVKICKNKIIL
jgi:ankyrin repeat protein